jgi:hypothetical protein
MYELRVSGGGPAAELSIIVLHTETGLTELALREAARLTWRTPARITLLALAGMLDSGQQLRSTGELIALAERVGVPVTIHVGCDENGPCDEWIPADSIIVLGVRRGWPKSREERMAERLLRAGHAITMVAGA